MGVALQRHVSLFARQDECGGRGGVSGVAQVAVHLQHWATVEGDVVARLVALGVVRVRGMSHVG